MDGSLFMLGLPGLHEPIRFMIMSLNSHGRYIHGVMVAAFRIRRMLLVTNWNQTESTAMHLETGLVEFPAFTGSGRDKSDATRVKAGLASPYYIVEDSEMGMCLLN